LYLRTAALNILQNLGRASPSALADWANYENWLPCFQVDVIGTNGAGDATIAGFLAALLRNLPPLAALNTALAVGACNVEAADSLSGICSWQATQRRMNAGWARRGL
jgi:sugar/nucleoside kinase (ribokinase family)